MAKKRDLQFRRRRLWEENPQCHWCKRETIWSANENGVNPPNSATIDHIYSRYNIKRREPNITKEQRYVLACQECNHRRAREEDLEKNPKRLERLLNETQPDEARHKADETRQTAQAGQ